jgi:hypothetical protein
MRFDRFHRWWIPHTLSRLYPRRYCCRQLPLIHSCNCRPPKPVQLRVEIMGSRDSPTSLAGPNPLASALSAAAFTCLAAAQQDAFSEPSARAEALGGIGASESREQSPKESKPTAIAAGLTVAKKPGGMRSSNFSNSGRTIGRRQLLAKQEFAGRPVPQHDFRRMMQPPMLNLRAIAVFCILAGQRLRILFQTHEGLQGAVAFHELEKVGVGLTRESQLSRHFGRNFREENFGLSYGV